MTNYYSIYTSD